MACLKLSFGLDSTFNGRKFTLKGKSMLYYRSFYNLSEDIRRHLHKIHEGGYDLVVGIPRSGMIPAYLIGLYANLNVTDIDGFIQNRPLKNGITRRVKVPLRTAHDARKVLLVDDSILSGNSMASVLEKVPENLMGRVTSAAIYTDRKNRDDIGLYFECAPTPRVFEWNIFHREMLSKACVDIDGVLCLEPSQDEFEDENQYLNYIINAKPVFIPTYKIHSLVTSRSEEYRPQTEKWLKENGVEFDNLIMQGSSSRIERLGFGGGCGHKADYFKNCGDLSFFIAGSVKLANQVKGLSAKPVYCLEINQMLLPNMLELIKHKKKKVIFKKIGNFVESAQLRLSRVFLNKNREA